MTQLTFSDAEYAGTRRQTRREVLLTEMDQVIPWSALLSLFERFYPEAGRGRRPNPLPTMLRIHFPQQWYALSDPAMEEALYEIAPLRQFAKSSLLDAIPDETTMLHFRHLLERYDLAAQVRNRERRSVQAGVTAAFDQCPQLTVIDGQLLHSLGSIVQVSKIESLPVEKVNSSLGIFINWLLN